MSLLIILFSIIFGYLFFMMSFYLLAKGLFPKIQQSPEEDELLLRIDTKNMEVERLNKESARLAKRAKVSYGFNKPPQIA